MTRRGSKIMAKTMSDRIHRCPTCQAEGADGIGQDSTRRTAGGLLQPKNGPSVRRARADAIKAQNAMSAAGL